MSFILPWHVSLGSLPAPVCLIGHFASWRLGSAEGAFQNSPGVPNTLSRSSQDDLPFSLSFSHKCKKFEKFIDRNLNSAWRLKPKSLGLALKNSHKVRYSPLSDCLPSKAEFSSDTSMKQNIATEQMQKRIRGSGCHLLGQPLGEL